MPTHVLRLQVYERNSRESSSEHCLRDGDLSSAELGDAVNYRTDRTVTEGVLPDTRAFISPYSCAPLFMLMLRMPSELEKNIAGLLTEPGGRAIWLSYRPQIVSRLAHTRSTALEHF